MSARKDPGPDAQGARHVFHRYEETATPERALPLSKVTLDAEYRNIVDSTQPALAACLAFLKRRDRLFTTKVRG